MTKTPSLTLVIKGLFKGKNFFMRGTGIFATVPILITFFEFPKTDFVSSYIFRSYTGIILKGTEIKSENE